MDRRCDDATAVGVEINPQRRRLSRSQTNFALEAIVECRAANRSAVALAYRCRLLTLSPAGPRTVGRPHQRHQKARPRGPAGRFPSPRATERRRCGFPSPRATERRRFRPPQRSQGQTARERSKCDNRAGPRATSPSRWADPDGQDLSPPALPSCAVSPPAFAECRLPLCRAVGVLPAIGMPQSAAARAFRVARPLAPPRWASSVGAQSSAQSSALARRQGLRSQEFWVAGRQGLRSQERVAARRSKSKCAMAGKWLLLAHVHSVCLSGAHLPAYPSWRRHVCLVFTRSREGRRVHSPDPAAHLFFCDVSSNRIFSHLNMWEHTILHRFTRHGRGKNPFCTGLLQREVLQWSG